MDGALHVLAAIPFWTWLALTFLVPVVMVAIKLCRFLDEATQAQVAKARDLERNFQIKAKAETALVELALLFRSLARESDFRAGTKPDRF